MLADWISILARTIHDTRDFTDFSMNFRAMGVSYHGGPQVKLVICSGESNDFGVPQFTMFPD
jgi:hypothetical protein